MNRSDERRLHGRPVGRTRNLVRRGLVLLELEHLASSPIEDKTWLTHNPRGIRRGRDITIFVCNLQQRKGDFRRVLKFFSSKGVNLLVDTRASRFHRRVFHPGECELFDVQISDLIVSETSVKTQFTP